MLAVASLPWVIPSLVVPVHADPAGAAAFAARADTPFGALGSLLMLGGIWNAQAVPSGYGGAVSVCWLIVVLAAVAGYVLVARRRRIAAGLGVAAVVGYCVAALGDVVGIAGLAEGRDLVLARVRVASGRAAVHRAAGAGGVDRAGRRGRGGDRRAPRERTAKAAVRRRAAAGPPGRCGPGSCSRSGLAPVLLLPGLAWGAVGRLRAVEYPADWVAASKMLDGSREPGSVLLLPWAQYRQYPWNHDEPVFDPWPRMLARPMIWNDALTVGRTTVAAESESAPAAGASSGPLTFRLLAAGVKYVIVDAGPLLGRPRARLATLARLPDAQVCWPAPT